MKTSFRKTTLPFGLTVVSESVSNVRSLALGIWVNTGSRDEDARESGMAHLEEHLLFKGTATRSASQIAKEVDAMGGHLNAFTTREYTCFFINLLDDRLHNGGALLADIFINASLDERDVELERGVVLEEIKMAHDDPEDYLNDLSIAQVWGDNPLSRPILGTMNTVAAFNSRDVRSFFQKHYHANNAVLTAVGNLEHDAIIRMASRLFEGVREGSDKVPRIRPSFHPGVIKEEKPLNQVYIDINLPGTTQADPLRYAAHVFNTVLGGSLSSRLFQKIREERGLVYSIFSGLVSCYDCGLLNISASTGPDNVTTVVELIMKELGDLRQFLPTPEEIRRAKDHLIGNLVLSMESTSNRMGSLGKQELYFGREVTMEETMSAIEKVSRGNLEEISEVFFGDKAVSFSFLGPSNGLPDDGDLPLW